MHGGDEVLAGGAALHGWSGVLDHSAVGQRAEHLEVGRDQEGGPGAVRYAEDAGLLGPLGDTRKLAQSHLLGVRLDYVQGPALYEGVEVARGGQALSGRDLYGGLGRERLEPVHVVGVEGLLPEEDVVLQKPFRDLDGLLDGPRAVQVGGGAEVQHQLHAGADCFSDGVQVVVALLAEPVAPAELHGLEAAGLVLLGLGHEDLGGLVAHLAGALH